MPEATAEDLTNKVAWGESYFDSLYSATRSARFQSATVSTVTSVGLLAWYSMLDSEGRDNYSFLLYYGVTFLGLGISEFIFPTSVEQEYKSYKAWKQGQSKVATSGPEGRNFNFAMLPQKDGFMANLNFKF